jgi:hypothetical protein
MVLRHSTLFSCILAVLNSPTIFLRKGFSFFQQALFTPLVGALMAITVTKLIHFSLQPLWMVGLLGGTFALVLKLVQVGWFFRLRGIPPWVTLLEDILCVCLVLFAFKAPKNGGLIAMLLLWIAIRSSTAWRAWYLQSQNDSKLPPD